MNESMWEVKNEKNIGLLIVVLLVIAMIGTYVRQQINEERAIEKSALGKDMEELETGLKKGIYRLISP